MYIYDMLYRVQTAEGKHEWVLGSNSSGRATSLLVALNQLSTGGWEIVGIGDFGYGTPSGLDEILLRKPSPR